MKKFALLSVVCAILVSTGNASDKSEKHEDLRKNATEQIEQAISKTNIFDLPIFQMKAQVQIQSRGKFVDGTYQFLWNGPDQWREEIALPGYTEVQVGGKGTVTIRRSTDFLPLGISALHTALGFGSGAVGGSRRFGSLVQSGLASTDVIKKIHSRKEHGDQLSCVEVEDEQKVSSEMCVNQTMGVLIRNSSFADKDFQPFGGRVFPRFLSFLEDGETVAKINVIELTTPGRFPPESFTPLGGVSPLAGCMNPVQARIVKKVPPEYPETARRMRVQGRVGVDAWIGADGIAKVGKVVAHVSPDLDQSAVSAISQWRYEPATCGGKPVTVETVLSIKYSLSN